MIYQGRVQCVHEIIIIYSETSIEGSSLKIVRIKTPIIHVDIF